MFIFGRNKNKFGRHIKILFKLFVCEFELCDWWSLANWSSILVEAESADG